MTTKPKDATSADEAPKSSGAKTDTETTITKSPAGDVKTTTETTTARGDDGTGKTVKTTQHRPGGGSETRTDTTSHATAVCVVDDGTPHTGRAVPGTVVCSAHTFRYHNDGTPRDPSQTGQAPKVVEKDTLTDTDPKNQEMVRDATAPREVRNP